MLVVSSQSWWPVSLKDHVPLGISLRNGEQVSLSSFSFLKIYKLQYRIIRKGKAIVCVKHDVVVFFAMVVPLIKRYDAGRFWISYPKNSAMDGRVCQTARKVKVSCLHKGGTTHDQGCTYGCRKKNVIVAALDLVSARSAPTCICAITFLT